MNRRELLEAIEWIRTLDHDMPVQTLSTFLFVSTHGPECDQKELTEYLGMTQSTASRNVSYLSKRHRHGAPGMGVLESVENPEDRRYKVLRLTDKGKKLAAWLDQLLEDKGKDKKTFEQKKQSLWGEEIHE